MISTNETAQSVGANSRGAGAASAPASSWASRQATDPAGDPASESENRPADKPPIDPTAAIVIIAAEVLSGKVVDANGPFLLAALRELGVEVVECRTIGDTVAAIAAAVATLASQVDYVITTGGIGPTHDDVTLAGVAQAFGQPLVLQPQLAAALQAHAVRHGPVSAQLSATYRRMAEVPAGAELVWVAPLSPPVIQLRNVTVLPGVPELVRKNFSGLSGRFRGRPWASCSLYLYGDEVPIAAALTAVQAAFADVAIGSYPRFDRGRPEIRLTLDGRHATRVEAAVQALLDQFPTACRTPLPDPR